MTAVDADRTRQQYGDKIQTNEWTAQRVPPLQRQARVVDTAGRRESDISLIVGTGQGWLAWQDTQSRATRRSDNISRRAQPLFSVRDVGLTAQRWPLTGRWSCMTTPEP